MLHLDPDIVHDYMSKDTDNAIELYFFLAQLMVKRLRTLTYKTRQRRKVKKKVVKKKAK